MLTSAIEQAGERLLIAIDLNRVEILALRRIVMAQSICTRWYLS